jgi:hypothetical protein
VTTTASNFDLLSLSSAFPENIPCTHKAYILDAPASLSLNCEYEQKNKIEIHFSAALQIVPENYQSLKLKYL